MKAPKVYFCDNGLLSALLNIASAEAMADSLYTGNLWENFVLTELWKQGFRPGKNLYYYRDQNGYEVDFLLEKGGNLILVEAKHSKKPRPEKLHFQTIVSCVKQKTQSWVACPLKDAGQVHLKDYGLYNPLTGFTL